MMNVVIRGSVRVAAQVNVCMVSSRFALLAHRSIVCAARASRPPTLSATAVRYFKTFKNKPPAKGQRMKVKSTVKKRFRVTGSGALKYKKAGLRHNLGNKSTKQKRNLGKKAMFKSMRMQRNVKKLLMLC